MSFILDALKKSETERQRQAGPALFEVRVAPPRTRFPTWAIVVAVLLAVNLAVVAWFVTRGSPAASSVRSAEASVRSLEAPPAAPQSEPRAAEVLPPSPRGEAPAPAAPPARAAPSTADGEEPAPELFVEEDPDAFEPAVARAAAGRVTRGTELGVPTYEQLASRPGAMLPDLRLDLHAFAAEPRDRFIFLNNTRLREGERLPDGTHVESIVPDGVILSVRGMRFLLQRH